VITQLTMLSAAVAVGVLELSDRASVPTLVVASAVTGLAFAFEQPPRRTFVIDLVDVADAPNAVSLDATVNNVSKILGPAAAAPLVFTVGLGWCFIVNGATCVAALVSLALISRHTPHRAPPLPRGPGQIRSAFRTARSAEAIRVPLLILTPVAVLGFNWNVLIPLLTTEELNATSTMFAVVMSVMSIGSVSGTLWLARRGPVTIRAIALSCICFGVANAALALSPTIFVAAAAGAAVGATAMVLFNASVIGMQMSSEPGMRGRIMGIFSMVFIGSYGIGGPIAGAVAEHLGARAAIGLGSITALLVGGAALVSRVAHGEPGDRVATANGERRADAVA
jgi:MFS family permease